MLVLVLVVVLVFVVDDTLSSEGVVVVILLFHHGHPETTQNRATFFVFAYSLCTVRLVTKIRSHAATTS